MVVKDERFFVRFGDKVDFYLDTKFSPACFGDFEGWCVYCCLYQRFVSLMLLENFYVLRINWSETEEQGIATAVV